MNYFVTGATGFIGKRLVAKLLTRPDAVVHFLTRAVELPRLQEFYEYWGTDATRVIPIVGDLTQPELGVAKADVEKVNEVGALKLALPSLRKIESLRGVAS